MPKKSKGKHRLDKFYHLAKEQGYRSRAAFKLIQLNRKYDFLTGCQSLLDLCAAPGGWMQVAAKTMPVSSLIIGVDLDPIRPIRGCKTLIGDITTQKTRQDLKKAAGGNSMDVVLHDGAPNVGGAWSSEAYQQSWLVLEALKLATEFLAPRGTFVTKVFRSQDYNALLYAFNQLFDRVDATKPVASRNTSAEIFVTCKGYKAPAKIDPRLLDAKHLFKETAEAAPAAGPDALLKDKIKQKRHREGYEEGVSVIHRPASAASFIAAERPVESLGRFTSFALDGPTSEAVEAVPAGEADDGDAPGDQSVLGMSASDAAAAIRKHPATTAEIRQLCGDLQVLGRSEFKALLKWRLRVRKDMLAKPSLPAPEEDEATGAGADADENEDDDAKESALLAEMAKVKETAERRLKKEKKRKREAKIKARIRAAQMALGEGINDAEGGEPLFSLAAVKGRGAVGRVAEQATPDEMMASSDDDAGADANASGPGGDQPAADDADDEGYLELTEAALEDTFAEYQQRQGQRASAARRKRRRLGQATELDGTGSASEDDDALAADGHRGFAAAPAADDDEALLRLDLAEDEGLLVKLDERRAGRPPTSAAVAAQWFAQDLFEGAEDDDDDEQPAVPRLQRGKRTVASPAAPPLKQRGQDRAEAEQIGDEDDRVSPPRTPPPASGSLHDRAAAKAPPAVARSTPANQAQDSFQVVPLAASDSDSDAEGEADEDAAAQSGGESDAEFMEELDVAGKAEVLALAKRMLRRKSRDELLEGAYNKYAFHDAGALPRWFAEDQQRYARPPPVVSREELEAEKQELAAIDARPIKKIAEAKARKKRRLAVSLEKARQKSEAIVNQEDVPMRSRMKEVEKVYAKARAAGKGAGKKKQTRSAKQASSRKGRPLDRRMMSDKRETQSKRKKVASKKRTKGKKPGGGAKGKGGGRR